MKFGVGQSIGRVEDRRFITGIGCYTDDVDPVKIIFWESKARERLGRLVHRRR